MTVAFSHAAAAEYVSIAPAGNARAGSLFFLQRRSQCFGGSGVSRVGECGIENLESSELEQICGIKNLESSELELIRGIETLESSELALIRGIETLESSELALIRGIENLASREFVEARTWN
jgi:hypothetical protein